MDLSKILTIAGKNGLFRIVSQSKTGLIVESLTDGKKIPVFATDRYSALQDISVFTRGEDKPLKDILLEIFDKEEGKPGIDPKSSPEDLKARFESIIPDFDQERVYHSDIKKIFTWYNLLLEKGMISKEDENTGDTPETQDEPHADEMEDKPAKKAKGLQKPVGVKPGQPAKKPGKIDTGRRKTLQKK